MKIKNDHLYREMGTFWFQGKHMVMFMDKTSKMAFLELDEKGKFHYPELRDVLAITDIIAEKKLGVQEINMFDNLSKAVKKFKFIPKVKLAGAVVLLSASTLVGCGKAVTPAATQDISEPQPGTIAWGMKYGSSTGTTNEENNENTIYEDDTIKVTDGTSSTIEDYDEKSAKYVALLSPADDEYDYKYANDYTKSSILDYEFARDSSAYEHIFGYSKPTEQELYSVIDKNKNLSSEYKQFIKEYVSDWLSLWPESDFSVLKHNLETLEINEVTERQIQAKAASIGCVACYSPSENAIYINEEANVFDKTSNDYIVLMHELTHAARGTTDHDFNGKYISIGFYEDSNMGLYEDEALDTYFVYKIQEKNTGIKNKAQFYCYQSSIYRELLEGMDYDGADYMNHSVNYFIDQLQVRLDELGVEIPAYHFINLIDSQATMHYKDYIEPDYTNFTDLFDLEVRNWIDLHVTPDMTYEETEQQFEAFYDDIMYNISNLSNPYPEITENSYRPSWNQHIQELGITQNQGISR